MGIDNCNRAIPRLKNNKQKKINDSNDLGGEKIIKIILTKPAT